MYRKRLPGRLSRISSGFTRHARSGRRRPRRGPAPGRTAPMEHRCRWGSSNAPLVLLLRRARGRIRVPGRARGAHGARKVFVLGLGVFAVGSAACAAAPALGVLIAARAVQGLGASALLPCSLALLVHQFPDPRARARERGRVRSARGARWARRGSRSARCSAAPSSPRRPGARRRPRHRGGLVLDLRRQRARLPAHRRDAPAVRGRVAEEPRQAHGRPRAAARGGDGPGTSAAPPPSG